ncbi:hypothetical protein Tco_0441572, partial [Tanacetum coccineum]
MTTLKYSNKHNMVAFLKKPNESVGFTEIVDFLKGTSLRYALTHNPTIYDSLVKQFGQNAQSGTCMGTQELVSIWIIRNILLLRHLSEVNLQLADAAGISNLPDADIYAGLETLGRGYAGDYVPLLPVMMAGAAQVQGLDSGNIHESPLMSHEIPSQEGYTSRSVEDNVKLQELMVLVPKLESKIGSLEKELKDTKQTFRKAILTLVDRVKTLEVALKRKTKKVVLSDSKNEETEAQGRKIKELDDDPLVSLVKGFVTPSKTTVSASNEEQIKDISPTTLEAAKTLSKVASQKPKSVDKGRRYKRRKESKGKDINTGLDFEAEVSTGFEDINSGYE